MQENREDEYERRRKEESKKSFVQGVTLAINMMDNITKRHYSVKDPATRNALLVDKLCLSLDAGIAFLKTSMDEYDLDLEFKNKIDEAEERLQKILMELMHWVTNPVYSPDHPFGYMVMKEAEEDFNKNQ